MPRKPTSTIVLFLVCLAACLAPWSPTPEAAAAQEDHAEPCHGDTATSTAETSTAKTSTAKTSTTETQADVSTEPKELAESIKLPAVSLIDQDGQSVDLRSLAAGKTLLMNFIFTSCTTVCPPMGALFARLQQQLTAREGEEGFAFISISIDPVHDTPDRLKQWAEPFEGAASWRLLTGPKAEVDRALKELGVFSALKEEHAPLMLLGEAPHNRLMRAHGLSAPEDLIRLLDELKAETSQPTEALTTAETLPPEPSQPLQKPTQKPAQKTARKPAKVSETAPRTSGQDPTEAARQYFTDTPLVDQYGREHRFYSDLLAGKTVVINPFFATCTGSCPVMHRALAQARRALGDRLGRDVFLISITVDPENDTPARLRHYAESFGDPRAESFSDPKTAGSDAPDGWSLLTGEPENVRRVLAKLGQQVSQKEAHQSVFLIGNDRTGLWQKLYALGPPETLVAALREVANDTPSQTIAPRLTSERTSP